MDRILHDLGERGVFPIEAVERARSNREAAIPLFLAAFERAEDADERKQDGLFLAFHLLGEWRETSAYRPLLRFLRQPISVVEPILGDAIHETADRVVASVFDGDPEPIYDLIRDPEATDSIRSLAFDTLVLLVFHEELPREEVAGFLRGCYAELQPQAESPIWEGWQSAVALLGLSELELLVKEAFGRGLMDPLMGLEDFLDEMRLASDGGSRLSWAMNKEFKLLGNVAEELSDWAYFRPDGDVVEGAEDGDGSSRSGIRAEDVGLPAANLYRGVGRNDPCPCGSGKKFKKCCLDKIEAERVLAGTAPRPCDPPLNPRRP